MNSTLEVSSQATPAKWEPDHTSIPNSSTHPVSNLSIVARLIGFTESYWSGTDAPILDADLAREGNGLRGLLNTLQEATGIEISKLDPTLLLRRLAWRMRLNGVDDLATYETVLAHNPAELPALRKSLLIRVTDFFRDPNVYFELERTVIPDLLKRNRRGDENGIRVLVTGCGTGEEAYSLAMLIEAIMKRSRQRKPVRILGNDEDKNALNQARRGYYPHLVTADLSPFCLDHFFEATKDGYRINEQLRNYVRFVHSETDDPSTFSDLDLLVCRNPLMFRSEDIQQKLIQAFYSRLRPGGYLVLEPTVRSNKLAGLFEELDVQHGLYRRKEGGEKRSSARIVRLKNASVSREARAQQQIPLTRYLEEELFQTQERLRLTIVEYEAAHDELVDQNHKLQVALRGAVLEKEQREAEYTSLKEMEDSILRANRSLKTHNETLSNAYTHLEGIIAHSGIGFLFLNGELGIDMFTPGAGSLFDLKRSDIGRPISSVDSPFHWDIAKSAESVLRSQTSIERQERSRNDRWYRVKVQPYILDDNHKGIVCTFVDVTDQQRANEWDQFKAEVLNQMQDAVVITNKELQVTYVNKAAIEQYNLFNKKVTGCKLDDLYRSVWKDEEEKEKAFLALAEQGYWAGEHHHIRTDGKDIRVESSIHVLKDQTGEEMGMLMVVRDIQHREKDQTGSLRSLIADLEKRNEEIDKKLKKDSGRLQEAEQ